jgi:cytochrome P450
VKLDFPLQSPDFYAGDPYPTYRILRNEDPVHFSEGGGFWVLTKYEDIRSVSCNPDMFTSTEGIMVPDAEGSNTVQEGNLIFTDPPRHRQLRRLISSGFTPRNVTAMDPKVREIVATIVSEIEVGTVYEFAEQIAAPLPTRIIAEMLGAPVEDWEKFRIWSDAAVGMADPDVTADPTESLLALYEYFQSIINLRTTERQDDVISILIDADVDGEQLTPDDLLNFCFLLLVAGNETTRNLIALGTLALLAHPDQHRMLIEDPQLIPGAVEEMLRWTSPVTHMARTAKVDLEIRGQAIKAGQLVVMLYGAGNRDEEVFGEDAEEFDVLRSPNPHLAFGFGGHQCLGAALARMEARAMFEELLSKRPNMQLVGDVVRMRATMVPGVKKMPVLFS